MMEIYRVKIYGRIFESRNLRQLLAAAVTEKRNMDRKLRFLPTLDAMPFSSGDSIPFDSAVAGRAAQAV